MVGAFGGRGFLAALILPSGVDEGVMFAVAPPVDMERTVGRGGSREAVGEGLGCGSERVGDEGEGEPKGLSESNSSPGVEVEVEDAMTGRMAAVRIGVHFIGGVTCLEEHASGDNGGKM